MESDGIGNVIEVKTDSGMVNLEPCSIKLEADFEKKDKVDVKKERVDVKKERVDVKEKEVDVNHN